MQIQSYFFDHCSPKQINPNKSMSCTYAQALRNSRADVVSQVALDQYTWLPLSCYEVKHREQDLPKYWFISWPLTTRIEGDRTSKGS